MRILDTLLRATGGQAEVGGHDVAREEGTVRDDVEVAGD
jgi:hypothetical protein